MHLSLILALIATPTLLFAQYTYEELTPPPPGYDIVEVVPVQRFPRGLNQGESFERRGSGRRWKKPHPQQTQPSYRPHPQQDPYQMSESIKEPITAETGHGGHHDYVDYGAYTGGWGAFGWYSDHPVGGGWGG